MTQASVSKSNPPAPHGLAIGAMRLRTRYLLAPLAGYTNLAFRLAVRELGGVGLATTDLVNARALLRLSRKSMDLIQTCPADRPLAVQIYGAEIPEMCAAAQFLENYGASAVDINMGCPVRKVVRGGGGSAMMCHPEAAIALVRAVVDAVRIPVTVKMRLGWDATSLSAPFFAREFEKAGVAAVTIHGRTREQGFSGHVNLDGIRAVVDAVDRIPVIGNGDVRTAADAERMFQTTGCAGISIGRGALANPWILSQLRCGEDADASVGIPTFDDRLRFMTRHFSLLVEHRGERYACLVFRKMATWHCKSLSAGREAQQTLVMLDSVATFERVVAQLRESADARRRYEGRDLHEFAVAVPKGPIERW
jgi:nifR3 family TIM-barrel protein